MRGGGRSAALVPLFCIRDQRGCRLSATEHLTFSFGDHSCRKKMLQAGQQENIPGMNGYQGIRTVPLLCPLPLVWKPRQATSDPRTGGFPCRLDAEAELALEAPSWFSGLWSLGTNMGVSAGSPHLGTVRFSESHLLPGTKEFIGPCADNVHPVCCFP